MASTQDVCHPVKFSHEKRKENKNLNKRKNVIPAYAGMTSIIDMR